MTRALQVLGFPEYVNQSERLAVALGAECDAIEVHRFPDGESRLRLPSRLSGHIVICRSLDHPNDKLVELLLAARGAREAGAERLTLVAPYLCYMRQDVAFNPGEVVSQRVVGDFLAGLFDSVITVDPHLHRVSNLEQAVPARRAVALSAAEAMVDYLAGRIEAPLFFGPDAESEQWVRAAAEPRGFDFAVAHKERLGDRAVRIVLPQIDLRGRQVVLLDDVVSTGRTLAECAAALRDAGAARVTAMVTHALFCDHAEELLKRAGVEAVWSTDSIGHRSNVIELAPLLAGAVEN